MAKQQLNRKLENVEGKRCEIARRYAWGLLEGLTSTTEGCEGMATLVCCGDYKSMCVCADGHSKGTEVNARVQRSCCAARFKDQTAGDEIQFGFGNFDGSVAVQGLDHVHLPYLARTVPQPVRRGVTCFV